MLTFEESAQLQLAQAEDDTRTMLYGNWPCLSEETTYIHISIHTSTVRKLLTGLLSRQYSKSQQIEFKDKINVYTTNCSVPAQYPQDHTCGVN